MPLRCVWGGGYGPAVENYREAFSVSSLGVYAWIGINFVLGRFDHEDGKSVLPCDVLQGLRLLSRLSAVCVCLLGAVLRCSLYGKLQMSVKEEVTK